MAEQGIFNVFPPEKINKKQISPMMIFRKRDGDLDIYVDYKAGAKIMILLDSIS